MNPAPLTLHAHTPATARSQFTARVKALAARHGLAISAVSEAGPIEGLGNHLRQHVAAGHLAGMDWFDDERATISADISALLTWSRSVLSVGLAYWPGRTDKPDDGVPRGRISRYAWGLDYHRVLRRRMRTLHTELEEELGRHIEARFLVDTARTAERALAAKSGLGWIGKNACLIVPGQGSWVLLGELVTDLDLEPDLPLNRSCGKCTICLDQCPTGAIVAPYTIHAPTCISFLTIELRGPVPRELRPKMGDWLYGCDVCQETCPYTGAARPHDDDELRPASLANAYPSLPWVLRMTAAEFAATYFGTPVPRVKRHGLARNAAIALGNIGTEADVPVLGEALTGHDAALVRGHAAWALGRISGPVARRALDSARTTEPDDWVRAEISAALAGEP